MNITNDFKNNLMKRREILVNFESNSNPGFAEVQKMIADEFKESEDRIVIKDLSGNFGNSNFLVNVFIYEALEAKNIAEPKKKEKKTAEGAK